MTEIPSVVMNFIGIIAIAAITGLLGYLVARSRIVLPEIVAELKTSIGPEMWDTLENIAHMAVLAAQQARLNEWIENTGEAAKEYAVNAAQKWLDSIGAEEISADAIADLIEAAYAQVRQVLEAELARSPSGQSA